MNSNYLNYLDKPLAYIQDKFKLNINVGDIIEISNIESQLKCTVISIDDLKFATKPDKGSLLIGTYVLQDINVNVVNNTFEPKVDKLTLSIYVEDLEIVNTSIGVNNYLYAPSDVNDLYINGKLANDDYITIDWSD